MGRKKLIKAAAVQINSVYGSANENLKKGVGMVKEAAANGAELICLPELWNTGYVLNKEFLNKLAEPPEGKTISLFRRLSAELNVVLIIPFAERGEDSSYYISAAVIDKDGSLKGVHRKSLLWGREKEAFQPGKNEYTVYNTSVGRVGVLICYDAEFPEPARILALKSAEIITVPSVWSTKAERRWDIQLPARALDNQVYILGVNASGENLCGKSKVINPFGKIIGESPRSEEHILYGGINKDEIKQAREEIPYLKDYHLISKKHE
ncbi:nitrilase-related carbon-nitrogen hydrolase [Evansella clarkii]|uniref:nitrilase-related carbon-nitrogen hydrolase n=1 Tax=Evansella clarkii TaxID=79879 RepID=UPI000B4424B5|nr:nitrilase-related carbon-nitrogen hydrolase [Evansella clarkii]